MEKLNRFYNYESVTVKRTTEKLYFLMFKNKNNYHSKNDALP